MTPPRQTIPHGAWPSPIDAAGVARGSLRFGDLVLDGADVYWSEGRAADGGRSVVVRAAPGAEPEDVVAAPFSVRSRVHEYGGGAFTVRDGVVVFVDFVSQRLHLQRPGGAAEPLTPAETGWRFANPCIDAARSRVICVGEEHTGDGVLNSIVSVPLGAGEPAVLAGGDDFCSNPVVRDDGRALAWVSWNHPNMPWDGTRLWIAEVVDDGTLGAPRLVAGGDEESVLQPLWSPDGVLHFVSDRTGWWNLYRDGPGGVEPVVLMEAELGLPQWVFGMSCYAFGGHDAIVFVARAGGRQSLYLLRRSTGEVTEVVSRYTSFGHAVAAGPSSAVAFAGSGLLPRGVVEIPLDGGSPRSLRMSASLRVDPASTSVAEPIAFASPHGGTAHALYYAPRNADAEPPPGELPPLVVHSHGGPTAAADGALDLGIQYLTSRGIAVVDVDYGGSTGYGRDYRNRLRGTWGIVDVEDCIAAARYLVERGDVDGDRLAITGGSAGGYTTLCALTFHDAFAAGASHFGVADLELLARDTHKFESRYLDRLVAPYPEGAAVYRERSPIHHLDRLSRPVIVLQGLEDKVVPPAQSELLFAALRDRGIACAYLPFEGEQHGFRRAENIARALEAELYFFGRVLGFTPAGDIAPVEIVNLR